MCTIYEMYQRIVALRISQDHTVGAIELTAPQLADVNRKQLDIGRNADGDKIIPEYSKYGGEDSYANLKHLMNPAPGFGTPDLKYTGDFHKSIRVYITSGKLNWEATDLKATELLAKYGKGGPVLGVYQNTALENYQNSYLYPVSISIIKAATGAK